MFKLQKTRFNASSPSPHQPSEKSSQKQATEDVKSRYETLINDPSNHKQLQSFLQEKHQLNLLSDRQIAKIKNRNVAGGILVGFALIGYSKMFYAIYQDSKESSNKSS